MVLADINIAKSILETYEEIIIDDFRSTDKAILFKLYDKQFALLCPEPENITSRAVICVVDESDFDYPHIMLGEVNIQGEEFLPNGRYRSICLHEQIGVVASIQTYEEKIIDEIDRLIELMNLSAVEKEREYQKEFLFYWNSVAQNTNIDLFMGNLEEFSQLEIYRHHKDNKFRYLSSQVNLCDIAERIKSDRVWQQRIDINAFFIPIIDNRGIVPPRVKSKWGISEITNILYGKRISHISSESYNKIKTHLVSSRTVDLVFKMEVNSLPITFAVRITFKDNQAKPLLQKILEDVTAVQEIRTNRQDYYYLNKVIGNPTSDYVKKVLLVGAGSLGSYVASELAKNGYSSITIFDGDELIPDNFMRWAYGGWIKNYNKGQVLKFCLEQMHPEICIFAHGKNIDAKTLIDEMNNYDYIIFTVGSSDIQIQLNRVLKKHTCKANVIFTWLEAGGTHSHILYVNYAKQGCFECLFTDSKGELVNNKANLLSEETVEKSIIRNGCGGTRVAYGTSILLRTVSALLDLISKIENEELKQNCLVDIESTQIEYKLDSFVAKECRCCGNKT